MSDVEEQKHLSGQGRHLPMHASHSPAFNLGCAKQQRQEELTKAAVFDGSCKGWTDLHLCFVLICKGLWRQGQRNQHTGLSHLQPWLVLTQLGHSWGSEPACICTFKGCCP